MKVFQALLIAAVLFKQSTGVPVIASEEEDIESIVAREEHAHTDTETFTLEERDVQAHKRDCGCKWCQHKDKYLSGYCTGCSCRDRLGYKFDTLDEAKAAFCKCSCSRKCGGITYEPFSKKYTLRKGSTPLDGGYPGVISWVCSKDDKNKDEEDKDEEDKDEKDKDEKDKDGEEDKKKDKKDKKKKDKKDKKKKDKKDKKKKKKKDKGQLLE